MWSEDQQSSMRLGRKHDYRVFAFLSLNIVSIYTLYVIATSL